MSGSPEAVDTATITEMLLAEETLQTALGRIGRLAVATIPSCDSCGTTMAEGGTITDTVPTDATAQGADEFQYGNDDGPCVRAIREGIVVHIPAMPEEDRWPSFATAASDLGIVSSLSVPLRADGHFVGALNLYSTTGAIAADEELAEAFADQAAVTLDNARLYAKARELVDNLNHALESRDVIGQAKGIIMAGGKCTADEAFDVLRTMSQRQHVKLRDIAQRVADTGSWDPA